MSHIDGTMEYGLKRPVKYSKSGDFVEATFLEFKEFSGKHRKQYLKLKKVIERAMVSAQSSLKDVAQSDGYAEHRASKGLDEQSDGDRELDAKEAYDFINACLSFSPDADLDDFVDTFRQMVCNPEAPLCKIDGEVNIKPEVFNDMHPDDQLDAALRYCGFFGIGLGFLKGNGSNSATTRHTQAKAL